MGTRIENGETLLSIRTVAGDGLEIEQPAMSEETERGLIEQVRLTVAGEDEEAP